MNVMHRSGRNGWLPALKNMEYPFAFAFSASREQTSGTRIQNPTEISKNAYTVPTQPI
jgi:hypothetical protein